jgi:glycosyltransferase involved in cell wall biosynthesis
MDIKPLSRGAGAIIACHAWHEDYFGGAFKLAAEFGRHLVERGYSVHFICGTDRRAVLNPTHVGEMRLWRYRFRGAFSPSPLNLWGHLFGSFCLARRIASEENVVFLNGHSPLQFLGAAYALPRHVRRIYSVHSPFVEELQASWAGEDGSDHLSGKKTVALKAAKQLERMIYRKADTVQCDSGYSLSVIQEQYPREVDGRGIVCPGWIDIERFQPIADRDQGKLKLGEPWIADVPAFLTVRRLERRMGLSNLIIASKILRSEGYHFRTLIGGRGPLQHNLELEVSRQGLGDTVHLLGKISEKDLPLCYAAADCFVLPTRSLECFGLIVLEAFASGTPVIATPVGSIPEVMGDGFRGWLAEDASAIALADKMRAFLKGGLKSEARLLRQHAERFASQLIFPRLERIVLSESPNN